MPPRRSAGNDSIEPVEEPETPEPIETSQALSDAQAQLQALQDRIDQGLTGERQWTETQIATFRQELADLKATLATLSETLPSVTALQEQLTLMQQETRDVKERLETISPPLSPTTLPAPITEPAPDANTQNGNNRARGKTLL